MNRSVITIIMLTLLASLSACAPRVAVKPIPASTPPECVLKLIQQKEEGLKGLRAFAKITIYKPEETPKSFEAVIYVARPDKIRITGISFLGSTAFDAILTGDTYWFSQSATGYTETGPRADFAGMLRTMGIEVDPEAVYSAIFSAPAEGFYRNFIERTKDGYSHYILRDADGVLAPEVRADYDAGLDLVKKTFYDETANPYLTAEIGRTLTVDGYTLPGEITVKSLAVEGEMVKVDVEKYLVNPEGMEGDFQSPAD